ncbi:MAG: hypothetical protein PVF87_05175, partial [Acidimicrobiia bacterium]
MRSDLDRHFLLASAGDFDAAWALRVATLPMVVSSMGCPGAFVRLVRETPTDGPGGLAPNTAAPRAVEFQFIRVKPARRRSRSSTQAWQ